MQDEDEFFRLLKLNARDDGARLAYADWLEAGGDDRARFLRLQVYLASLPPDHPHRPAGEHELSRLRKNLDAGWLSIVEPELVYHGEGPFRHASCSCLAAYFLDRGSSELRFHTVPQDTECDAWKRLLDLVEEAAADERSTFAPRQEMDPDDWCRIATLPPTIASLKSVKHLMLYGSHLVRIPPEIGQMTSLEEFTPYTSLRLHWFPYELTRCKNLKKSTVSTRALYGNWKFRPPFPRLQPEMVSAELRGESDRLPARFPHGASIRNCSVCDQPFTDEGMHRAWISIRVATDVLPLLVNACSSACILALPEPASNHVETAHTGGLEVEQPRRGPR